MIVITKQMTIASKTIVIPLSLDHTSIIMYGDILFFCLVSIHPTSLQCILRWPNLNRSGYPCGGDEANWVAQGLLQVSSILPTHCREVAPCTVTYTGWANTENNGYSYIEYWYEVLHNIVFIDNETPYNWLHAEKFRKVHGMCTYRTCKYPVYIKRALSL